MHFAKRNIFALAAAVMTALSVGAGAAAANPVGYIKVVNNGAEDAVFNYGASGTWAVNAQPEFKKIPAGKSQSYVVTARYDDLFSMRLAYETPSFVTCKWDVTLGTKYKYNYNVSHSDRITWEAPEVRMGVGSHTNKCDGYAYGYDTGESAYRTDGDFSATLIIR